jgi:UDP-N-acetylmuramoyl-L-alanyl-D-glutamate--2,6-diaminopimelate ligase
MADDAVKVCVMEASSHALDLKRVDHVKFDYAVFTNLTEDHLDYHQDFETYYRAKSKLFYLAKKGRLINTDDVYGKRLCDELSKEASSVPVLSYGLDGEADIRAKDICYLSYGCEYTLVTPSGEVRVHIPLPGKIYVYNTLAAFGVLHMMGITNDAIQHLAKEISMVPGRMEIVRRGAPVRVFVDYAHTPDALSNAIDIVRSMTDKKVITVFGCGGDRDKTKRPIMGEIAERKSDKIYVTSDNPRTENPNQIITDIIKGLINAENAVIEPDRKRAIGLAIGQAQKGDIVLIAGKGHETYQDIDGVKHDFDDKKIALGFMNAEEKE